MKWGLKDKKKYSISKFFKSFSYAFLGIKTACKNEQNLLFDIIFSIIVIILSLILKISIMEFTIVLLCIALVITLELVNTAIEYTVDLAMPRIHPLAKKAKDIAAGAVLIGAIIAFIIGVIIFLPKVLELF